MLGGFEVEVGKGYEVNVEGYYKGFSQLIGVNRK